MNRRYHTYSILGFILGICLILTSAAQADWWDRIGRDAIRGSGQMGTEDRDLDAFDAIVVDNSTDLDIKIDEKFTATLEGDDNLLKYIITEVRHNTLYVTTEDDISINTRQNLRLYLTMPTLTALEIQGSSDVRAQDLKSQDLFILIAGSGDVDMSGTADEIEIEIDGSGDVDGRGFDAKFARVDINGSGDVALGVTERLRVSINGSGDVTYYGDPSVRKSINGSGDIIARRR